MCNVYVIAFSYTAVFMKKRELISFLFNLGCALKHGFRDHSDGGNNTCLKYFCLRHYPDNKHMPHIFAYSTVP